MTCIEKIYSLSVLVGDGRCNGNCSSCAGKYLRPQAEQFTDYKYVQANFYKNFESAIKLCARYGGWSLSLTSAGEPTVCPWAVTAALKTYQKCANQGAYLPNVNLFTNGILLGDKAFCEQWLPQWKDLGLTNVAVSVYSTKQVEQSAAYGVSDYPYFQDIFANIRAAGLGVRTTLLLKKSEHGVSTCEKYVESVKSLFSYGIDNITSWPVGNPDGSRDKYTPSRWELFKIKNWLERNAKRCHTHAWGGGVYDYHGNILRLTDYVTKHDPDKDFVRQLVVFQDGTVAYSWIKDGALCMK